MECSINYKFGVIYAEDDQFSDDEDEKEMFKNSKNDFFKFHFLKKILFSKKKKLDKTTKNFQQFLDNLGEKIVLKEWKNFNGDLDTTEDKTGKYSYFTVYEGKKIMFHVNTLISTENSYKSKKFFDDNIVNIIFCETPEFQFHTDLFDSSINQVFIIVTISSKTQGSVCYRVDILKKTSVDVISPSLPNPPLFLSGSEFRKFILSKGKFFFFFEFFNFFFFFF